MLNRIITFSIVILVLFLIGGTTYKQFRVNVPAKHICVLTKRTGKDLTNNQIIAPDKYHKGIQKEVLSECRAFYNPWDWDWNIYPMVEIPVGKMGIVTRLYGEDLPYGEFIAKNENQKGIVSEPVLSGRYPGNAIFKHEIGLATGILGTQRTDYIEIIELFDPVHIPAGFLGIVTNLSGDLPDEPNTILSPSGKRGVIKETYEPGTYYINPYEKRVNLIDCRSQKFNISEGQDMGFPSKDGFWVNIDGSIEFRVQKENAAENYVLYNEIENDTGTQGNITEEIIRKIITTNSRNFCRLRGSNNTGREFIGGETRSLFQKDFTSAMQKACNPSGIEVLQALISKIIPPQAIANPIMAREIARQQAIQYTEQVLQQEQEALLATEKAMIERSKKLKEVEQETTKIITLAKQNQATEITKAEERKAVALNELEAAKDLSSAITAKNQTEAQIISLGNKAEAKGWQASIAAFNGDGNAFAEFTLKRKIGQAIKSITSNTQDSEFMKMFNFQETKAETKKD